MRCPLNLQQTAMSAAGRPEHEGDIAAQLGLAVDNIEAVLGEAGTTLANLVRPVTILRSLP